MTKEEKLKKILILFNDIKTRDKFLKLPLEEQIRYLYEKISIAVKGEQGEKGDKGDKPIAGIDYPIPKDGKDGYTPIKGVDYFDGGEGRPGINGKDADPQIVAEKASKLALGELLPLIPKIEAIENDLPKLGANIASALELLPDGEKLKLDAIEGLKDLLEELKNRKVVGGGGGFSKIAMDIHFIHDETPTNSGDDLNFTINHTPNPTASLKLYRNGQRQKVGAGNDYTFSGRTITLLTELSAGEILVCDYQT